MPQKVFHYLGSGRVYVGRRRVGVVSDLQLQVEENTIDLIDSENPGGGTANSVSRVTAVNMTMSLRDFRPENLALALRGRVRNVAAGTVTGEEHSVVVDRLVRFEHIDATEVEVTDGDTTTYVAGTDYELTASGLIPLSGGAFANATEEEPMAIEVDYEFGAEAIAEALVEAGQEFEVVFDGVNEADSGAPMVVDVYRFRPSPAEALALISADDFAALEVSGRVLVDTSKGAGLSGYFRAVQKAA
ncbi:hypothetical protein J2T57_002594 [Natronocella acetinitrilica]|uniref:Uncharacterized protein n=1 Tax=Natronocella acetinitrilica TaxID=414046 RepID=A0AAE3G4F6_9GAMM|nr:hypothetical protein [Natronocella acetinitrilica]MCP1675444.1 hypothetical protein [Natronocella acetinitrilica]